MVGIRLIFVMAIVGGLIAYLADKLGSKIGKKKMSVFGLRPKHTALLLTVLSGIVISVLSVVTVSISSESARTALFGMEQLRDDLKHLNQEKENANKALEEAKKNVIAQNEIIELLDKDIKNSLKAKAEAETKLYAIESKYTSARMEVKSLVEAKDELFKEIKELESTTDQLRKGITRIREGEVFFRAGELVHTAVLRSGMSDEENRGQILWMLQGANESALQRLGELKPSHPVQIVWVAPEILDEALKILNKSKHDYVCRVRTIANVIVGELVVCELEMFPNKLVYKDGEEVYSANYDAKEIRVSADALVMEFLGNVNHVAVNKGVLPDPLTGKVGKIDAETMVIACNAVKKASGKFVIRALAKHDVTAAGPVEIVLKVKQIVEE